MIPDSYERDMAYMMSRARRFGPEGFPTTSRRLGRWVYTYKWCRPGWVPYYALKIPFAGWIWRYPV